MSDQYKLTFVNQSNLPGVLCVYQKMPNGNMPNIMSLAWLTKAVAKDTELDLYWTVDYSFVWSETGSLKPGVTFKASQVVPADLQYKNQITLNKTATPSDPLSAYTFVGQPVQGTPTGSLIINQGNFVEPNKVSVGIGMSGNGVFAVQGEPNINALFTPHPNYYVTFGNYQQGTVLDITQITNMQEITFPPNVFSRKVTLGTNNLWTVQE